MRDDPEFVIVVASDLIEMLDAFGHGDEETSAGPITVVAMSPDGHEVSEGSHPVDSRSALTSVWRRAMVHAPPESNPLPIECVVHHQDWYNTGKTAVPGYLHWVKETGVVRFALSPDFSDAVPVGQASLQRSRPELDSGVLLLQPITRRELAGIEPILAELWKAIDEGSLTETQQHQIAAMAKLIKTETIATIPEKTERWKLIGTVRCALKYLASEVPRDALAWWKLIDLLQKVDWPNVARHLPQL